METVLELSAPVWGFFLGTLLFSRVGAWIQAIASAVESKSAVTVVFLNSGPWLLAAVVYWAYYVLSGAHARRWDWFFGGLAASIPIWLGISVYLHARNKKRGTNAV